MGNMNKHSKNKNQRWHPKFEAVLDKIIEWGDAYIDFLYRMVKWVWLLVFIVCIVFAIMGKWDSIGAIFLPLIFIWGLLGGIRQKDLSFLIWWNQDDGKK